VEYENKKI
jgi:hypothetical protein